MTNNGRGADGRRFMFVDCTPDGNDTHRHKARSTTSVRQHVMRHYLSHKSTSNNDPGRTVLPVPKYQSQPAAKCRHTKAKEQQHAARQQSLSDPSLRELHGNLLDPFSTLPVQNIRATDEAFRWHFYNVTGDSISPWLRNVGQDFRKWLWNVACQNESAFHSFISNALAKKATSTGQNVDALILLHRGMALKALKTVVEKGDATPTPVMLAAIGQQAGFAVQEDDFASFRAHMKAVDVFLNHDMCKFDLTAPEWQLLLWLDLYASTACLIKPCLPYTGQDLTFVLTTLERSGLLPKDLADSAKEKTHHVSEALPGTGSTEKLLEALHLYGGLFERRDGNVILWTTLGYSIGYLLATMVAKIAQKTGTDPDCFTASDVMTTCAQIVFWTLMRPVAPAGPFYINLVGQLRRSLQSREGHHLCSWWKIQCNGRLDALVWVFSTAMTVSSMQAMNERTSADHKWLKESMQAISAEIGKGTKQELFDSLFNWPHAQYHSGTVSPLSGFCTPPRQPKQACELLDGQNELGSQADQKTVEGVHGSHSSNVLAGQWNVNGSTSWTWTG